MLRHVLTALTAALVLLSGVAKAQQQFALFGTTNTPGSFTAIGEMGGINLSLFGSAPLPTLVYTNDFTTTCAPAALTPTRGSTGWDYNGSVVLTAYTTNVPICPSYFQGAATNYGIGYWPARTNILLNSTVPATQTRTTAGASTRVTWVIGSGSIAVTGSSPTINCTATQASPCVYQNGASQSVTYTKTGTVTFMQDEVCIAATVTFCSPSAPIITAGAQVARSADLSSGTLAGLGLNNRSGTFLVDFMAPSTSNANQTILYVSDGTAANNGFRLYIRATDQKIQAACENAGVIQYSATTAAVATPGTAHTVAFGYSTGGGITISVDGTAYATTSGVCNYILTKFHPGNSGNGTGQLTGYIQKIRAYNGRLPNAYVQALTAPLSAALSGALDVMYLDGQSNAEGRRGFAINITTPPCSTNCLMFNDLWGAGGPRLNYAYTGFGNPGITNVIASFEAPVPAVGGLLPTDWGTVGIVAAMAQRQSEGSTKKYVGRAVGAGGQTIALISAGSNSYNNIVNQTAVLAALTTLNGGTTTVSNFGMVLGESDRNNGTSYASYFAAQPSLSSSLAAALKSATGQSNNPVWYQMQLAASGIANGTGSVISQAQYDVAIGGTADADWRLCVPRYIFHYTPEDGLHQPGPDDDWMGEYFGHCQQWEADNATPWKPTYFSSIVFNNPSQITATAVVQTAPIQFDTTTPIQGKAYNHGLQFVDSCILAAPSTPYTAINGVTVATPTTLTITLSTPYNPACTSPTLRSAWDAPGLANQTTLPTVSAGGSGGGSDGACTFSVSFNTPLAQAQATYTGTISGGALSAITAITSPGLYPPEDALTTNPKNSVAVVGSGGCASLTGATVDGFYVRQSLTALNMSAAWTDIRDSTNTVSRLSNKLYNWLPVFSLPVAP